MLSTIAGHMHAPGLANAGRVTLGDIGGYLVGNRPDRAQQAAVRDVFSIAKKLGISPKSAAKVGRFAGRLAPGLSAVANIGDVADIINGDESFANKAMDVTAMGIGGTVGAFMGGPLGASMGASAGKSISDATQFLLGGGKSPEERKLEEALALLNGGRI